MLLRKLKAYFGGELRRRRVAIWGLAFKPRTDDIRQSPALTLVDGLLAEGATVLAHDPEAMEAARAHFGGRLETSDSAMEAVAEADALVLVTEWRCYQNPDFASIRSAMAGKLVVDGRNVWSGYQLGDLGFDYVGIGVGGG